MKRGRIGFDEMNNGDDEDEESEGLKNERGSPRRSQLAELTGQQLVEFSLLNRTDTRAYVEKRYEAMHATGLTLVRIFCDLGRCGANTRRVGFGYHGWIPDAAAKNGIQIAATFVCAGKCAGMGQGRQTFYHNRVNLNDPADRTSGGSLFGESSGSGPRTIRRKAHGC